MYQLYFWLIWLYLSWQSTMVSSKLRSILTISLWPGPDALKYANFLTSLILSSYVCWRALTSFCAVHRTIRLSEMKSMMESTMGSSTLYVEHIKFGRDFNKSKLCTSNSILFICSNKSSGYIANKYPVCVIIYPYYTMGPYIKNL